MCGEKMEVLLEAGCVTNCTSAIAGKLPGIMRQLCKALEMREVAWFFINDVRIGETVALVDKVNGYTYRVRMEAHAIRVLEIYENSRSPENTRSFILVNWGLLRAVSNLEMAVAA
jgi:hypothetical protein